ncbi:AAA family ATPase [Planococcaceae bacterium Storch 2/2-2]|nr:AAA family ATPase [Planococcaceae bacterium Storch 2/2-2]
MVKVLEIEEFKLIKNTKFEFSQYINAIAGGNGTAKSTLLHLISNSYKKPVQRNKDKKIVEAIKIINQVNAQVNVKVETLTKGDKKYNSPARNTNGTLFTSHYFNNQPSIDFRSHNSKKNSRFSIKPPYRGNDSLPEMPVIYLSLNRLYPFGEFDPVNVQPTIENIDMALDSFHSKIKNLLLSDSEVAADSEAQSSEAQSSEAQSSEAQRLQSEIEKLSAIFEKEVMKLTKTQILQKINFNVPDHFLKEVAELQRIFTNRDITINSYQNMADFKNRVDFDSDLSSFDSNTLSAGEENLYIILTALASLINYAETLEEVIPEDFNNMDVSGILLIDEFDASLHPAFQILLLNFFEKFSKKLKIQIFFTTHSLTTIEQIIERKQNLLYLIKQGEDLQYIPDIDLMTIEKLLREQVSSDLVKQKIIIYTEDNEARAFLDILFEHFKQKHDFFARVLGYFYIPELKLSSNSLEQIFTDETIRSSFSNSICILDGDQTASCKISHRIITLPGNESPEDLLLNYLVKCFDNNDQHITKIYEPNSKLMLEGYQRTVIEREVILKLKKFEDELRVRKESGHSNKGKIREFNKKMFNDHYILFEALINNWITHPNNKNKIEKFFNDLKTCFIKAAKGVRIPTKVWPSK